MNKDPRSLFMFLIFFVTGADFFASTLLSGAYSKTNKFPNAGFYLNYSFAYNMAVGSFGGTPTGFFAFVNIFIKPIQFVISMFVYAYNVLNFLYLSIIWLFNLINYPFTYIPPPLNVPIEIVFYATFGLAILTGITILGSGLRG